MTNYFSNLVFLTRNTSLTLTEVNQWSWFEFEYYMKMLKQALDEEAEKRKQEQKQQLKQQQSMKSQLNQYLKQQKH